MKAALLFVPGVLFGMGLAVSGMTSPRKVVDFLDVAGTWDPSLLFVMAGAVGSFALWNLAVHRWRRRPLLGGDLPGPRTAPGALDRRLVVGAAIFGIGWGLAGFCPGPAVTDLATLHPSVLAFVPAMLVGMLLAQRLTGADRE